MRTQFASAALGVAVLAVALKAPAQNDADVKAVVAGNTAFALGLYAKLKEAGGNLSFSPHSLSTALAMTYAGARGESQKQIAEALRFPSDPARLHPAFGRLDALLREAQKEGGVEIRTANALWAQKDFAFLPAFCDLAKVQYGAMVSQVDFRTAAEKVRAKINRWVEQQTKGKIVDLIPPGALDAESRLVLTNAIYFNGAWAHPFDKGSTKDDAFWPAPERSVKVPMMSLEKNFGYLQIDGAQILELPYKGYGFSMVVILPEKLDGLGRIEEALTPEKLTAWMGRLEGQKVRVSLPRFKITSQFGLKEALASMGMRDAFSTQADFSGMTGAKDLRVTAVVHKAFVEVNERGTEAAAATGITMGPMAAPPSRPVVFRADHPFLFLIRHTESGALLFVGRVADPSR